MADVIRVLEGPLASVRGIRPDELAADGVDQAFVDLWVAVRVVAALGARGGQLG